MCLPQATQLVGFWGCALPGLLATSGGEIVTGTNDIIPRRIFFANVEETRSRSSEWVSSSRVGGQGRRPDAKRAGLEGVPPPRAKLGRGWGGCSGLEGDPVSSARASTQGEGGSLGRQGEPVDFAGLRTRGCPKRKQPLRGSQYLTTDRQTDQE